MVLYEYNLDVYLSLIYYFSGSGRWNSRVVNEGIDWASRVILWSWQARGQCGLLNENFLSRTGATCDRYHTLPCVYIYKYNSLLGLWNPEVQCCIHKGSPIIPILSRINPIHRINTYFFKIHSNIVLPFTRRSSSRSLSFRCTCWNFESTLTFLHLDHRRFPVTTEWRVPSGCGGMMSRPPDMEVCCEYVE